MSRLSLLRLWNRVCTFIVFSLPLAFYFPMSQPLPSSRNPTLFYESLVVAVAAGAWAFSLCSERIVGWLVRGATVSKAALLVFLEATISIEIITWFLAVWDQRLSAALGEAGSNLLWGLTIHLWMWPFSLPLFLLCSWGRGRVNRALYERRDYLPEVEET